MRWCSLAPGRLGALLPAPGGSVVVDVVAWGADRHRRVPADVDALVASPPGTAERLADALLADGGAATRQAATRPRLLAPLRAPNSLRDFLAYRSHAELGARRRGTEVPEAWEEMPVYYKGNRRSILGPGAVVPWPSYTRELDYECEVAAVVGRPGRDLTPARARGAVFGYTVMNDWSARDVQRREMSCWLGPAKGKDFATSLGPVLVTADEWDPDDHHEVTGTVDAQVWSRGSTAGRRWSFPEMLAWASRDEDLYPTDVIGSGTFGGGCGLDLGRYPAPGQSVAVTVEGLGSLDAVVGHPGGASSVEWAPPRTGFP